MWLILNEHKRYEYVLREEVRKQNLLLCSRTFIGFFSYFISNIACNKSKNIVLYNLESLLRFNVKRNGQPVKDIADKFTSDIIAL